jgi:mRNA interferase RelE/StbE
MPNWNVLISRSAAKALARAPRLDRERLQRALAELAIDPTVGDVVRLTGERSTYRRRVGDWRIFFDLYRGQLRVSVVDIDRRTTTTYRRR